MMDESGQQLSGSPMGELEQIENAAGCHLGPLTLAYVCFSLGVQSQCTLAANNISQSDHLNVINNEDAKISEPYKLQDDEDEDYPTTKFSVDCIYGNKVYLQQFRL